MPPEQTARIAHARENARTLDRSRIAHGPAAQIRPRSCCGGMGRSQQWLRQPDPCVSFCPGCQWSRCEPLYSRTTTLSQQHPQLQQNTRAKGWMFNAGSEFASSPVHQQRPCSCNRIPFSTPDIEKWNDASNALNMKIQTHGATIEDLKSQQKEWLFTAGPCVPFCPECQPRLRLIPP
jgi:hypothetical protein